MSKKAPRTHLIIPDAQTKADVDVSHLEAARNLICELKPEVIVNIGDFWDMPALSSYSSKLEEEGRRVIDDIEAGNDAMALLTHKWPKNYRPEMHFTLGNHEDRITRAVRETPKLRGIIGIDKLDLSKWRVHKYLVPVVIDGVTYCHYFYNQMSGKPISGNATSMLNKIGFSFVQGHRQELSYARKDLANGTVMHGLVAGAFHIHDEDYKGAQAAAHWRGLVLLHEVHQGDYDIELISVENLLRKYL